MQTKGNGLKNVQEWLDAYGESHQNPLNKKIHWICVPLIMFSLIALLWPIQLSNIGDHYNAGSVLLMLSCIYYFILSWQLGIGMLLVSTAMYFGVAEFAVWLAAEPTMSLRLAAGLIFILAWIGQFIGHKIEGQKPSFLEDIQFLLIGPLWLLSFIYQRFGIAYCSIDNR